MFQIFVDWTHGVHPLIVEYIDSLGIDESRIKVINETEVIILNNPRE